MNKRVLIPALTFSILAWVGFIIMYNTIPGSGLGQRLQERQIRTQILLEKLND